jgi:hypothetical protein
MRPLTPEMPPHTTATRRLLSCKPALPPLPGQPRSPTCRRRALHRSPRRTDPQYRQPLPGPASNALLSLPWLPPCSAYPDPCPVSPGTTDRCLAQPPMQSSASPWPVPDRPRCRRPAPGLTSARLDLRLPARPPPTAALLNLPQPNTTGHHLARPLMPYSPDSSIPPPRQGTVHMLIHMFCLVGFVGDSYVD